MTASPAMHRPVILTAVMAFAIHVNYIRMVIRHPDHASLATQPVLHVMELATRTAAVAITRFSITKVIRINVLHVKRSIMDQARNLLVINVMNHVYAALVQAKMIASSVNLKLYIYSNKAFVSFAIKEHTPII